MKRLLFVLFLLIVKLNFANHTPKQATLKTIETDANSSLQLIAQNIKADIYANYAVVECYYDIQNIGTNTTSNIFMPFINSGAESGSYNLLNKNQFDIWINNRRINKNHLHLTDELKNILANRDQKKLQRYQSENKPMYHWQINLEKDEAIQIAIRYTVSLNNLEGTRNLAYSLQAKNWKGKIETSRVTFRFFNMNNENIYRIQPKNHKQNRSVYSWNFSKLSSANHKVVSVVFGPLKKKEEQHLLAKNEIYYLDHKKISAKKANRLKDEIGFYHSQKVEDKTQINIYSKQFVLNIFSDKVFERFPEVSTLFQSRFIVNPSNQLSLALDGRIYNGHNSLKNFLS